jgi:N-acetylglucosaminyldiphosphoundecaprenol N-acetyl-beta-D-mannosaminyltransferase
LKILGIRIDNLTKEELFKKIGFFLSNEKFHQVATVNQEFILEAQVNQQYEKILNECDLNVADSIGIKLAFWRYGKKLKARFSGADLMLEILKIAEGRGISVFLACRKDGLSSFEETKAIILKLYPKLLVTGVNLDLEESLPIELLYKLKAKTYNLVLCSFGAPYQEIFLNSFKNDIIGLGLGVGGSFDFITGKIKRAPIWMRKMGMEWLWRLIVQPWEQKGKRLKRIWQALVVFPIKLIFNKKNI